MNPNYLARERRRNIENVESFVSFVIVMVVVLAGTYVASKWAFLMLGPIAATFAIMLLAFVTKGLKNDS